MKPVPNVMVGITHSPDMTPIITETKVLKVGIGIPKGRACYVYIQGGRWMVRYGTWEKDKLVMATAKGANGQPGFPTRAEAEEWFNKNEPTFAVSNRPQKLPFFTFLRRVMVANDKNKPDEVFRPDWDAIEAHGETPREIDIVFMSESPLAGEYQAWSSAELKCHGDGLNALRVVTLGTDKWPGWKEATAAKEKYFPVSECWVSGVCPFAQEGGANGLVCKPNSTLKFQLASSFRLGATAYFTTTSIRSTRQLFSSFHIISSIVNRAGRGIISVPLKLVLAPFKTNHNGIPATQYGASLELRAEGMATLRTLLAESSWKQEAPKLLTSAGDDDAIELSAEAMSAEFYPDAEFEDEGEAVAPIAPGASTAKAKTDEKATALAEKIAGQRTAPETTVKEQALEPPTSWSDMCTSMFFEVLGPERFNRVLQRLFGSSSVLKVTAENREKVWAVMEAEKAAVLAEPAAEKKAGDLF